jgi:hypothetical protein
MKEKKLDDLGIEDEKLERLKDLVDSACDEIMAGRLDRTEATVLAQRVRRQAAKIIPQHMAEFDLIYSARLEQLIEQYTGGD